jgi:hypothetical protein
MAEGGKQGASRLSHRSATIKASFPLAHDLHCIYPSALFCHRYLPSPVTGRAVQPPEFRPRDVVGLTWSPLLIPQARRSNSSLPRAESPSTRGLANLVGRCLILRPAPSPPLSPFLSAFLNDFLRGLPSLPSPAGIENASPSLLLAAPLMIPFLIDLHASSLEARTWKIGRVDNTKGPMKKCRIFSFLYCSEVAQLRLENRRHDLRLRR